MDDELSSFEGGGILRYSFDTEQTALEEGQEAMLIEELQQKLTMLEEDEDRKDNNKMVVKGNQQENDPVTANTKTKNRRDRKVQNVLLVPTHADLLMERYRQAAKCSKKARALMERAFNWNSSVPNREQLAKDAFKEAGKARLLVEDNHSKTTEFMALLADAKAKGELEVGYATDLKVTSIVPTVKLPHTSFSRDGSRLARHRPPGLKLDDSDSCNSQSNTSESTISKGKNPSRLQCFQGGALKYRESELSGQYYDDEDGLFDEEEAEEHVFRAKQYLEFILPDLAEFTGNDAMTLNVHQQDDSDDTNDDESALGEISSLGYDESHIYDCDSSSGECSADEIFSMASLNDIMAAPVEEYVPDRIMRMPSARRKKFTIQLSFGGKSATTETVEDEPEKEIDRANNQKGEILSDSSAIEKELGAKEEEDEEEDKGIFKKEVPTFTTKNEKQFQLFSFFKKRAKLFKVEKKQANDGAEESHPRIVAPVLSDLSDAAQSKESIIKTGERLEIAEALTKAAGVIPPVLSELNDTAQSRESFTRTLEGFQATGELTTPAGNDFHPSATPLSREDNQLQLLLCQSVDSTNLNDKYEMIDEDQRKSEEDAKEEPTILQPLIPPTSLQNESEKVGAQTTMENPLAPSINITPLSAVSVEKKPSRYSPVNCGMDDEDELDVDPVHGVFNCDVADDGSEEKVITHEVTYGHVINGTDASIEDDAKEATSSFLAAVSIERRKKKNRRSLMDFFKTKGGDTMQKHVIKDGADSGTQQLSQVKAVRCKPQHRPSLQPPAPPSKMTKTKDEKGKINNVQVPPTVESNGSGKSRKANFESSKATKGVVNSSSVTNSGKATVKSKYASKKTSNDEKKSTLTKNTANRATKKSLNVEHMPKEGIKKAAAVMNTKDNKNKRRKAPKSALSKFESATYRAQSDAEHRKLGNKSTSDKQKATKANKDAFAHGATGMRLYAPRWINQLGTSKVRIETVSDKKALAVLPTTTNEVPKSKESLVNIMTQSSETSSADEKTTTNIHEAEPAAKPVETQPPESPFLSNPLLPYQLIKQHIEEHQSKVEEVNDLDPKVVAERSIIQAMTRGMGSELPSATDNVGTADDDGKENGPSSAALLPPNAACSTRKKDVLGQLSPSVHNGARSISGLLGGLSPSASSIALSRKVLGQASPSVHSGARTISSLLGESSAAAHSFVAPNSSIGEKSIRSILGESPRIQSIQNQERRPLDADGLNARAKDVREVLGLAEPESFGEERSRSYLSRISGSTYRQDFDLPDP